MAENRILDNSKVHKCHTLIVLVGRQVEPLYQLFLQLKPERLFLIHTSQTQSEMQLLTNQIKKDDFDHVYALHSKAFNFIDIQNTIAEKLASFNLHEFPPKEVVCDITGGTKLMSIALYNFAIKHNHLYTYLYAQEAEIEHSDLGIMPLEVRFTVSQYFGIKGYRIQEFSDKTMHHAALAEYIFDYYKNVIVNECRIHRKPFFLSPVRDNIREKSSIIADSAQIISKRHYDLASWASNNPSFSLGESLNIDLINNTHYRLKLNDSFEEDWKISVVVEYFAGGWLEDYIFNKLSKLNIFDDLVMNLKTEYKDTRKNFDHTKTKNELDIVGTKNGKLYQFEIKSGMQFYQDTIYKLSSVVSGDGVQQFLITLYHLKKEHLEKAKENNIEVITLMNESLEERINELI